MKMDFVPIARPGDMIVSRPSALESYEQACCLAIRAEWNDTINPPIVRYLVYLYKSQKTIEVAPSEVHIPKPPKGSSRAPSQ